MNEPQHAAPRRPPPEIPGYRIEGVLGRGASGTVYRALQLSVGRTVALKVMHPEAVGSRRAVRRLQREARVAAKLSHPNIISAIDMGSAANTWWFAMELVEGPSLAERLQRGGRLSEREGLRIFIPLCDALQHAFEKGVVHRDIKPANVLLEPDGRPRLVDLGLARVEDDPLLTRTGATLGTPHYISPEQARDPTSADVQSDIWSLGASMFHAVVGRPPFGGESAAELLSNVLYGPIPSARDVRPELSKGLSLVLRKCLSRDPDRRYFTPAEVREDLERVRAHKPPAIRRASLEPLDPAAERRRKQIVAGAAASAALIGLALFAWRPWAAAPEQDGAAEAGGAPWKPLADLRAELETGRVTLGDAWRRRTELCGEPAAPPDACEKLRVELEGLLENGMAGFWTGLEADVERALGEHDFSGLAGLLDRGVVERRLHERNGFLVETLPRRHAGTLEFRLRNYTGRLHDERERARRLLASSLQGFCGEVLWPRLQVLRQEGRWAEIRTVLDGGPLGQCEAARADARGMTPEVVGDALDELAREFESRKLWLRQEWDQLDRALVRFVDDRAALATNALRDRAWRRVGARFAAELDAELAKHNLARASMPAGFQCTALDVFERRSEELRELEEELIESDALSLLAGLEAEAEAHWSARKYEQAVAFWRSHLEDESLAPVRRTVELRMAEAETLAAFMQLAAEGVRARHDQRVQFTLKGIGYAGVLSSSSDPLRTGFRLASQGVERSFLLRPDDAAGEVLGPDALETFARLSASPGGSELALQRALFRYHEGDPQSARRVLADSGLSDDDLLVYDLGLRLNEEQSRRASERELREREARRILRSIVADVQGDRDRRVRRIDELLGSYGDVLSRAGGHEARELRRTLRAGQKPTEEDFRLTFAPDELAFRPPERVWLRFVFDRAEVGAWKPGDWHWQGEGWLRSGPIGDLEQLVAARAPKLALLDPFDADAGEVELELTFRQPLDAPPDLLVVSVCGFHAAFTRATVQGPARCLADTRPLADVLRRVRTRDEGEPFAGFVKGQEHRVALRVARKSGRVYVKVDGVLVASGLRAAAEAERSWSVSVRSLEPVLLLEATLEGPRP